MNSSTEELTIIVTNKRGKERRSITLTCHEMNGCTVYREAGSKKLYWTLSEYCRLNKVILIKVN